MKKYSQGEGNLEVVRGEEAVVLNEHLAKTGKTIADFSDREREALHSDLDRVRGVEPKVEKSPKDSESDSEE